MVVRSLLSLLAIAGANQAGYPPTPEQVKAKQGTIPRCATLPIPAARRIANDTRGISKEDLAAAAMWRARELFPSVGCKEIKQ